VPAFDGGDDLVRISGPDEGLGGVIVLNHEPVDGGLEIDDRDEGASLQAAVCELGEEALDSIEPRTGRRREVEGEAFVPSEPLPHLGMLVGGVVVEDHVDGLCSGNLGLDGVEEADELLMAMALHVAADDRAVEDVERREQGRRAVGACNRASWCRRVPS
jgi:hypothetical protein